MIVHYGRKSRPSGRILAKRLRYMPGPDVNFGYERGGAVNVDSAIRLASNKRVALRTMAEAGIPTPRVYDEDDLSFPCVGRPDKHFGGSDFWLCDSYEDAWESIRHGVSHFMEYIEGGREFRLHVAFGKSIKIAEKIGGGVTKNFKSGSVFMYPKDFNHKKTLRRIAKEAVASLGLDFGAVDIIYKDGKYYVLEVNTAPSLTSASDTLERYVKAFKEEYDE